MTWPDRPPLWRRYLRFWRQDVQGDIDDEVRFHFQARVEELTAQGASADAARAQAEAEFGDVHEVRRRLREIDERMARHEHRTEWLDAWRRDLAYAWRALRRTPGVTAAVVATLALGLGANTAMFSFLNAVFLKPPAGVSHPEQLRRLWTIVPFFRSGPQFWSGYDYVQYQAARRAIGSLGTTAVYRMPTPVPVGRGGRPERVMMSRVSSDFLPLLGVHAAIGRLFGRDEDRLGVPVHVAVVSDGYWRRALGADSAAIGRDIVLSGTPYTIIGVADPTFAGIDLDATDVWLPLATLGIPSWWTNRNVNGLQIVTRLAAGARDDAIGARVTLALRRSHLNIGEDPNSVTRTGSIIVARGPGRKAQEVQIATRLGGVALIVLLMAFANGVYLLLARAVQGRREIAMRLALGISRGRLARLILTESVMLALFAGVAAIVAAQWGGLALRALLLPEVHWAHAPVDWRVLAGAAALTLAAGLAAGAVPALQSGATDLNEVLKAGAREGFVKRSRARSALVVVQAALSVTLLVGAALFTRSLSNVRSLSLGFDADHLVYGHVNFYTRDPRRDSLTPARLEAVAARLRAMPDVQNTAVTFMRPMEGFSLESYYPDVDTIAHRKPPFTPVWSVSSGWFATQGTRILAGQDFPATATGGAPPSVIVNLAMARALWPGESPLGHCVRFVKPAGRCNTVIGVVENAHWGAVIEDPAPQFYLPVDNLPFEGLRADEIAVRANPSRMGAVTTELRAALRDAFPGGIPVIERMSSVLDPMYHPWRLGATLFTMFGVLAALVAALGVYSTVSYGVSLRTHEFGVRAALGATSGAVVRQVVANGLRIVAIGVAVGIAVSLAAGRLVASLLYGISPHDPGALAAVAGGLLLVAGAAMLLPAWRAARLDPVAVLRAE